MFSPMIGIMVGKKPLAESNMVCFAIFANQARFFRMDTTPWSELFPIGTSSVISGLTCDFNPTTKQFVIGGSGGQEYSVYDTTTYPFTHLYGSGAISQCNTARFSNDGKLLAIGIGTSTTNYVYDTSDYPTRWTTQAGQATSMVFNYDNTLLAVSFSAGSPTQKLWVYDVTTFPGTLLSTPALSPGTSYASVFHPTQNVLLVGTSSTWYLYNMDTFSLIATRTVGQSLSLKWNPAGDRLAASLVTSGEKIRIYDTSDLFNIGAWPQVPLTDSPTVDNARGVDWNANGEYLAAGRPDETPGLVGWDTSSEPYSLVPDFATPPAVTGNGVQDVTFLSGSTGGILDPNHINLVLFYTMDDKTGNVMIDFSQTASDGTVNGLTQVPGVINEAMDFSANPVSGLVTDYIVLGTELVLDNRTFSFRFRNTTGDTSNVVFGNNNQSSLQQTLQVRIDSSNFQIRLYSDQTISLVTVGAVDTNWHAVVVSVVVNGPNEVTVKTYYDGTLIDTVNNPSTTVVGFTCNHVGTYVTDVVSGANSRLQYDQMRIFNRAVTDDEALTLMAET